MSKLFLCYRVIKMFLLLAGIGLIAACSKSGFLDKKPNTSVVVPTTLTDLQALLDNDQVMGLTPTLGEMSSDNFYLDYNFWQSLDISEYNAYVWAKDIFGGQGGVEDWNTPYAQVFYANVVLAGLAKISVNTTNAVTWNTLEGSALFLRAYAFYNVAQLFAPVYDSLAAPTDLGIPLRLSPDVDPPSIRLSVQATYEQILTDLQNAANLLPSTIPSANLNRPSRPAALALLARVYLSMRAYTQAGIYANNALQTYSTLIDYNGLDTTASRPVPLLNAETIYQSSFLTTTQVLVGVYYPDCVIDSMLYRSYAPNDLRRSVFYTTTGSSGSPYLKGSYTGGFFPFSGLAVDEVYLIAAECAARAGDVNTAMSDLNTLLTKRWVSGTFTKFSASSPGEALDTILLERRKELAFRGIRWTDLRRLNEEGANITLTRSLNGQVYQLLPNNVRYILPIPPDVPITPNPVR